MDVLLVTAMSVFVTVYNSAYAPLHDMEPFLFPGQPFKVVGPFLSLLLVFRTNASYGRWAEARALSTAPTERSTAEEGMRW